jgi:hypothetical protein
MRSPSSAGMPRRRELAGRRGRCAVGPDRHLLVHPAGGSDVQLVRRLDAVLRDRARRGGRASARGGSAATAAGVVPARSCRRGPRRREASSSEKVLKAIGIATPVEPVDLARPCAAAQAYFRPLDRIETSRWHPAAAQSANSMPRAPLTRARDSTFDDFCDLVAPSSRTISRACGGGRAAGNRSRSGHRRHATRLAPPHGPACFEKPPARSRTPGAVQPMQMTQPTRDSLASGVDGGARWYARPAYGRLHATIWGHHRRVGHECSPLPPRVLRLLVASPAAAPRSRGHRPLHPRAHPDPRRSLGSHEPYQLSASGSGLPRWR